MVWYTWSSWWNEPSVFLHNHSGSGNRALSIRNYYRLHDQTWSSSQLCWWLRKLVSYIFCGGVRDSHLDLHDSTKLWMVTILKENFQYTPFGIETQTNYMTSHENKTRFPSELNWYTAVWEQTLENSQHITIPAPSRLWLFQWHWPISWSDDLPQKQEATHGH